MKAGVLPTASGLFSIKYACRRSFVPSALCRWIFVSEQLEYSVLRVTSPEGLVPITLVSDKTE